MKKVMLFVLLFSLLAVLSVAQRFGEPIGNYNFRVEIDGIDAGYFDSVEQISALVDVEEFRDGSSGEVRKLPGRVHYGDITLKRGLSDSSAFEDWIVQMQQGNKTMKDLAIILEAKNGETVKTYNLIDAFPVHYDVGINEVITISANGVEFR